MMVKYQFHLNEKNKEELISIILETGENRRRRKIIGTLLFIIGVVELSLGIYIYMNSRRGSGIFFILFGICILLFALNAKSYQKFILKRSQKKLDPSLISGVIEYIFDQDGINISSQIGNSKNYWTFFSEYGFKDQFIYIKRKDNGIILVDRNELTKDEFDELINLLTINNIKRIN